jgi:sulfatase maturation enzyme AslB (radical SAM superfamily)
MKNLTQVEFCGNFGDPLMHPQLDSIIKFFYKQKIRISTNASLRSEQWWAALGQNKNITVTFCIDGIGDTHELYRRSTSYKKIIKNAQAFIETGGKAKWQFIVFKHNEHQIDEAKIIAKKMGFEDIHFTYSDRFDTGHKFPVYENNEYLYDLEKSTKQITLGDSMGSAQGDKFWKKLYKNRSREHISCVWSELNQIYIHSDAMVYPCCMIATVQAGRNIEKLLFQKIVKNVQEIDLSKNEFVQILESGAFQTSIPNSLRGDPYSHPICIEWCNKKTGKFSNSFLNSVNT